MQSLGGSGLGLEDLAIYASLVGSQISMAISSVLVGKQLAKGSNPLTFVAYTNAFGGLVLTPFAFFLEKNKRSKLNFSMLARLLLLSLGGVCAFQTLTLMGLKETSPSFSSAMGNLVPAIIFVMAWAFGMEKVDIKCAHSRFKIVGTVLCVCGAMAMSLLQGPSLSQLWPSSDPNSENIIPNFLHESNSDKIITGCIYLITAVTILSSSIIVQAETLKRYPAPLSLSALTALLGSIETATLITSLDMGVDATSWSLDRSGVVTVMLGGIFVNVILITVHLWCIQKRGPVFVSTFNPVSTVCSTFLSSFVLGETLHLGSVMGALLILGGLYLVLWGKSRDIIIIISEKDEEDQLITSQETSIDIKRPLLH
ncbi:WAT1-related protein At5g47470 [Cryptomeria japonica]|uniref:WAT1-related protein At5g47470 n=1 Tax=Cryptomeria japonica TaxID=3369 RepID=UPI0027DA6769|nr:WAT1-related protein At5g47470 [Cryptomeria japonica]